MTLLNRKVALSARAIKMWMTNNSLSAYQLPATRTHILLQLVSVSLQLPSDQTNGTEWKICIYQTTILAYTNNLLRNCNCRLLYLGPLFVIWCRNPFVCNDNTLFMFRCIFRIHYQFHCDFNISAPLHCAVLVSSVFTHNFLLKYSVETFWIQTTDQPNPKRGFLSGLIYAKLRLYT